MSLRRISILVVTASLLTMLQCCNHMCVCEEDENVMEDEDDNDLLVEDEEEETVDIFEATHEWKRVAEGQAIPPGLHVRMNMQTGAKEAKLMSATDVDEDPTTTANSGKKTKNDMKDEAEDAQQTTSQKPSETERQSHGKTESKGREAPTHHRGFLFRGDQRRAHYYGHSDRRGIINKRRRFFSQREVAEALKKIDETNVDLSNLPAIEAVPSSSHNQGTNSKNKRSGGVTITQQEREEVRLEKPMHRELAEMLRHTKTLARQTTTVPELLQALEELEYHVHHFENAQELNSIGGLVLIVRLLNHTHHDVRSSAAHVIGAATQSNPQVQSEVLDYGALELLCQFTNPREPELVQRRGLFALSALLRGNTRPQLVFLQQCHGLLQLGENFHQRTMPTQLKIITLLTDLLHEQEELLHNSDELKSLLHSSVQEHGWCQHVPSLLHSDTALPTEKALQAMSVLQHLCDFTGHQSRLQELNQQFEEDVLREDDEVSLSLLQHSQELLKNIRDRNKEL